MVSDRIPLRGRVVRRARSPRVVRRARSPRGFVGRRMSCGEHAPRVLGGKAMRPSHLTIIFAVWCAAMLVAATGGLQHAVEVVTLPHVIMPGVVR